MPPSVARVVCVLGVTVSLATLACAKKTPADHLKRADDFTSAKKYQDAIVEYRSALQLDPKLGSARMKLADLYTSLGDTRNAYKEYIRAADALPNDIDAQMKAGAVLLVANQFADAKARAEQILRLSPRHPGGLTLLGNALAGLQDMDGALSRLNQAISEDPEQGSLYANLGVLQLARGDRQMAEASFKKAVHATPNKVGSRVALAHFYTSQSRDADAEAVLTEALGIDGKDVQVNANLAELYVRTGRPMQAEQPMKTVAEVMKDPASQFALADYYIRTNRPKQATAILETLAEARETHAIAKAQLAALDYTQGRGAEAHRTLDELLKKEPSNRTALLLKGRIYIIEKKYDEAINYASKSITADPARGSDGQFVIAQAYLAQGRIDDAKESLRQVLKIDPRSVPAQIALSRLYASRGEKQPAIEFAQQAVTSDPMNPDARLVLVRALLAADDTVRAEKEIRSLLAQFPTSATVLVQVGALYLSRHDLTAARMAFSKALELDATSPDALAGLVVFDLGAHNASGALGRLVARLRAAPDDARAWFLAAKAYAVVGDMPHLQQALQKTIELDPLNIQAFAMLGDVYGMQGKTDEALQQFKGWSEREPRSIAAHTMVAVLLEQHKQPAEAEKVYQHILELDPNAAIAANNLAWMYAESGGNLDIAIDLAQRAKSQAPDQPAFNDTLGWIYYKKDLVEQAVPLLAQAVEKEPDNAIFHYHLGMIYAKKGEDASAIASLKRALTLDPKMTTAAEAQRTLAELQVQ